MPRLMSCLMSCLTSLSALWPAPPQPISPAHSPCLPPPCSSQQVFSEVKATLSYFQAVKLQTALSTVMEGGSEVRRFGRSCLSCPHLAACPRTVCTLHCTKAIATHQHPHTHLNPPTNPTSLLIFLPRRLPTA